MPIDRARAGRLLVCWSARLSGVLVLGVVLYLAVRPDTSADGRPVAALMAAGTVAVALLVVAHVLEPRQHADETTELVPAQPLQH
jgi:hypothetical protein